MGTLAVWTPGWEVWQSRMCKYFHHSVVDSYLTLRNVPSPPPLSRPRYPTKPCLPMRQFFCLLRWLIRHCCAWYGYCRYGGSLGALNHAIVMDQFTRTRAGDSWWYERPGVLDSATYSEVQKTLLVSFTAMRMY
jgi:hypothetical protein